MIHIFVSAIQLIAVLGQNDLINVELQSGIDWSLYTEFGTYTDLTKSTELVTKLPLWQYWDTSKAEYEMGAIPSEMTNYTIYDELLSLMDKKTIVNGVVNVQKDVTVMDTDALLMHMIASIQDMYSSKLHYSVLAAKLREEKVNFAKKIVRVADDTGKEWRTASEIRAHIEIVAARILQFNSLLEKEKGRSSWRTENLQYRHDQRQILRAQHHQNMTTQVAWNNEIQFRQMLNRSHGIFNISVEGLHLDNELELRDHDMEFNNHKALLMKSSNQSVESAVFRIEQEAKMERENEKLFINLANAKTKSAEMQMDVVVEVAMKELMAIASITLQDPWMLLAWTSALCGVLLVLTLIQEVGVLGRHYFHQQRSRSIAKLHSSNSNPIKSNVHHSNAASSIHIGNAMSDATVSMNIQIDQSLQSLVLTSTCQDQLRQYLSCFLAIKHIPHSAKESVQLPNALFIGPPGVGKSYTAAMISDFLSSEMNTTNAKQYCQYQVVTLCGADLLALGPSAAGSHLRQLFLQYGASLSPTYKKTIIVMDEADGMIACRGKPVTSNTRNEFRTPRSPSHAHHGSPQHRPRSGSSSSQSQPQNSSSGAVLPVPPSAAVNASHTTDASDSSCFYQILCACRENNPNLAILLTTSRSLNQIDTAVLDRMDVLVEFQPPSAVLCAHYVLQCMDELLFQYLNPIQLQNESKSDAKLKNTTMNNHSHTQKLLIELMKMDARVYKQSHDGIDGIPPAAAETIASIPTASVPVPLPLPLKSASKSRAKNGPKVKIEHIDTSVLLASPVGNKISKNGSSIQTKAGSQWIGWTEYKANLLQVYNEYVTQQNPPDDGDRFDIIHNIVQLIESMSTDHAAEHSLPQSLWSYREIIKFIRNIQCDILGTESCVLTNEQWIHGIYTTNQNNQRSSSKWQS